MALTITVNSVTPKDESSAQRGSLQADSGPLTYSAITVSVGKEFGVDAVTIVGAIVILLLLVGLVAIARGNRRRKKIYLHGGMGAVKAFENKPGGVAPRPPRMTPLTCPSCGNRFTPHGVTVTTRAIVARHGHHPMQCPRCKHIWNAGRDIKTIRG